MTKRASISQHLDSLQSELLMILRYYLAWKRLIQFHDFHDLTREEFVDKIISLKCIENDLLIRIVKLIDNDKRIHSINNLLNEIKLREGEKQKLSQLVSSLSEKTKEMKKRRNEILAHLKIGEKDEYMPDYDFKSIIKLLLLTIDEMSNTAINYHWSDGSMEKYDLRQIL